MSHQAKEAVDKLKDIHEQITTDITFFQTRTGQYANKKRLEGPTFKEGDRVYLLSKNLKSKRPSRKLDHVRTGPFEIDKVIGKVNFRLRLPKKAKIHPVFHKSLLEPALATAQLQTDWNFENDEEEYDVERIVDVKQTTEGLRYLVKWLG